jgi:Protein of unknown function (DUF2752)
MIYRLRGRFATTLRAATPLATAAALAAVLWRFPPAQSSFYPQCPIYSMFHLECPGCGGTRALAALLHGHVSEALRLNALVTLMLPLAIGYGFVCYWRFLERRPLRWPPTPPAAIYTAIAVAAVFTLLRNLP